uniref:large ribosomal subunit protein uL16m-like n=1 Tax=Myxine glutinosa TaxID=7769 RepID=UPI00358FA60D
MRLRPTLLLLRHRFEKLKLALKMAAAFWVSMNRTFQRGSFLRTSTGGSLVVWKIPSACLNVPTEPPNYDDIVIPEKNKLKFYSRAPNVQNPRKSPKCLRDIRGPATTGRDFEFGHFGIVALGGGYLKWGHFEMIRLTTSRKMNIKTMFAHWRVDAPHKPITRKGLGQRMGGGKGAIDHYVTPVKDGQLVVEVGGKCEFSQVEPWLAQIAHKLPFPARAVCKETLEAMRAQEQWREENNQNPWTFKRIADYNMLGIRYKLGPMDRMYYGKYWGKFKVQDRV